MKGQSKDTQSKFTTLLNLAIIVIAVLEVIGERFSIFALRMLKPIPILLLIYSIYKRDSSNNIVPKLVKYGLMISTAGDITLMFNGTKPFIIGTVIFMVVHVIYLVAFSLGREIRTLSPIYKVLRILAYLIRILIIVFICYKIWNKIPSKILFVGYGALMTLENMATLARYQKTDNYSFYTIAIGSLVFAISDTLIAIFKFGKIHLVYGQMLIMGTYYAAQYLITQGAIQQGRLVSEIEEKKD